MQRDALPLLALGERPKPTAVLQAPPSASREAEGGSRGREGMCTDPGDSTGAGGIIGLA